MFGVCVKMHGDRAKSHLGFTAKNGAQGSEAPPLDVNRGRSQVCFLYAIVPTTLRVLNPDQSFTERVLRHVNAEVLLQHLSPRLPFRLLTHRLT